MEGKVTGMRTRVREPVKASGGMDHPRCFAVQSAAPELEVRSIKARLHRVLQAMVELMSKGAGKKVIIRREEKRDNKRKGKKEGKRGGCRGGCSDMNAG
jgi:hypothetical protein